jgi:hypothetical protein
MAHLEVVPRPKRPSWIWALIIILAILLGITIFKYCNAGTDPTADETPNRTEATQKP